MPQESEQLQLFEATKLRRNPNGSYKIRLRITQGDGLIGRQVSLGLNTSNYDEAVERANIAVRLFRHVGIIRGEQVEIMDDDQVTQQMNEMARELSDLQEIRNLVQEMMTSTEKKQAEVFIMKLRRKLGIAA